MINKIKSWLLYKLVHTKCLWKLCDNYISEEIGPFEPKYKIVAWLINHLEYEAPNSPNEMR